MKGLKTDKPVFCIGDSVCDIIVPYAETRALLDEAAAKGVNPGRQKGVQVNGGGTANNTAAGLGRLGVETYFWGKTGADAFGDRIISEFQADGVDTRYMIQQKGLTTAIVISVIGADREKTFFLWPLTGAAHTVLEMCDIPEGVIEKIGWVHATGVVIMQDPAAETAVTFLERCAAAGVTVSFDLNLRQDIYGWDDRIWSHLNRVMKVANVFIGSGLDDFMAISKEKDPESAALSLVRDNNVIISRSGSQGATAYTKEGRVSSPSYHVDVVDTVGAGDNFNSGFIAAAIRGLPLQQCLQWGNAAAAYSLQFSGSRNGPTYDKLMEFIEIHTSR